MPERYVPLSEVNELLSQENERRIAMGVEFNAVQRSAMEHAKKNSHLSKEQMISLINEIRELKVEVKGVEYRIPESLVSKIADILPQYKNDVRAIFHKERSINVEETHLADGIIEVVSKYI